MPAGENAEFSNVNESPMAHDICVHAVLSWPLSTFEQSDPTTQLLLVHPSANTIHETALGVKIA